MKINWKFWKWAIWSKFPSPHTVGLRIGYWLAFFWNFCKKYPQVFIGALVALVGVVVFRLLYPPFFVWWTVPTLIEKTTSPKWWALLIFLALIVAQMLWRRHKTTPIPFVKGTQWKAMGYMAGVAALLALLIWGATALYIAWVVQPTTHSSTTEVVTTPTGGKAWYEIGWLDVPWWNYIFNPIPIITALVIFAAVYLLSPEKGKKGVGSLLGILGAFAKLGLTLAIIAVLAIFIVGPKMFWKGDYTPPARHAVVAGGPPAPVGGAQAAPAVPATLVVPQSRTITIPVGDLNAPLNQWSEEVRVVPGWSFRWDVVGQGGKMGVLVDGATRVVNEPTRRTDTHATQSLRFISLEGRAMQIAVSYYR